MTMSVHVKGFGCRPMRDPTRVRRPASESLRGRKPRLSARVGEEAVTCHLFKFKGGLRFAPIRPMRLECLLSFRLFLSTVDLSSFIQQ
jgi:hypothetical protein